MGVAVERIEKPAALPLEGAGELAAEPAPAAWRPKGKAPRIGLYEPWMANSDVGWTEWVLDYFELKHTMLHNADIKAGGLRAKYDAIVLAQQSMNSIMHGVREGETGGRSEGVGEIKNVQRPEYTGGIGLDGAKQLMEFVREGGTLVALDSATELPLALFPIGVRGVVRSGEGESAWSCPGSIVRITTDTAHRLAEGLPKEGYAVSTGGQAFEIPLLAEFNTGDREVKAVAWYAKQNLLASGWLTGERVVAGKAAVVDARMGAGHVVLFGFRPQFRGQSFGTFRFLLNALYGSVSQ